MLVWTALITLSAALGALLFWLHAPAALMLGPLIAAILIAAGGGRVRFPLAPFVLAQGLIGCLIAKMVPLSIMGDILAHWQMFTAAILFVVAASSFLGWLMTRLQLLPGTTALWGMSPGAASVMTIMAESYGADIRLVAVMQYLRIVMVAGVAATVAALVATGKVLSPQFMVWLLPATFLVCGRYGPGAWVAGVAAMVLTQTYFPDRYWDLVALHHGPILLLCARNAVLMMLVALCWPRGRQGMPPPSGPVMSRGPGAPEVTGPDHAVRARYLTD